MSQVRLLDFLSSCQQSNIPLIAAVGDVHGQLVALNTAVEILETIQVPVIFLGDYVDRGPESFAVVDLLVKKRAQRPGWSFLRGNHESDLLISLKKGRCQACCSEEGCSFLEYVKRGMPKQHDIFLSSLPLFYEPEKGQVCFVHGHIRHCEGKKIVRGHVPVEKPTETAVNISLDTSAHGYLSIALLNVRDEHVDRRLMGYIRVFRNGDWDFLTI